MEKLLWSTVKVRFADCDPMRHLYSGNYFRYFLDAREDQILDAYGLNLSEVSTEEGVAWVVVENQIAFLRPAHISEIVHISSCLFDWSEKLLNVELVMYSEDKKQIKALQWTRFAFVDVRTQRSTSHTDKYRELFTKGQLAIEEKDFEQRFTRCRTYNSGRSKRIY